MIMVYVLYGVSTLLILITIINSNKYDKIFKRYLSLRKMYGKLSRENIKLKKQITVYEGLSATQLEQLRKGKRERVNKEAAKIFNDGIDLSKL